MKNFIENITNMIIEGAFYFAATAIICYSLKFICNFIVF